MTTEQPAPTPDCAQWTLSGVAVAISFVDIGGTRGIYFYVQRAATGTWSEPVALEHDFDAAVYQQYGGDVRNWLVAQLLPVLNAWLAKVIPAGDDVQVDAGQPADLFAAARQLIASLQFRRDADGLMVAELS